MLAVTLFGVHEIGAPLQIIDTARGQLERGCVGQRSNERSNEQQANER